eukprot:scaffold143076_cov81-Phaeocystis_antarctica.AAC.1
MTPGSSYSVSVVACPRSSAPEPRSEGRPSRSCDAAARRSAASKTSSWGDIVWVKRIYPQNWCEHLP